MSIEHKLSRAVPLAPPVAQQPVRRRAPRTFWGDVARRFWARKPAVAGAAFVLLALALAALAPLVAPRGYAAQDYEHLRSFPSALYWLGTDTAGRDLWARIVYGARVSLLVGLVVQAVAVLVGVPLGLIAGFCGGRVDALIMRVVDTFYAFPSLLFAILMMSWLGSGLQNVVIALSLTSWLTICRLVRAQTLSIREREFVTAAHAVGVPVGRILWAHIFPSTFSAIITSVTFGIPQAILAEATLSFIGIGINPPMPSWGQMVSDNILYIRSAWHLAVFPAAALGLTMLAFTALGDGLRDAFDPRDRN
ncbi:ABC transporter permease [Chloroflexia bacterium SDU3-3]|nr:ABC transporter permease [Chloroflexia bacterium SDU3-3]